MSFIIQGTIVQALPIQSGVNQQSGTQWQRASYIIQHEGGQYPKTMVFDVLNTRIQELNIQVGETLVVHMNCDAHEHNGRWYNSISAWKAERPQMQQMVQQPMQQMQQPVQQQFVQQQPMQQQPFPQQPVQQPQNGNLPFPAAQ